jgi:hypothetical protein
VATTTDTGGDTGRDADTGSDTCGDPSGALGSGCMDTGSVVTMVGS